MKRSFVALCITLCTVMTLLVSRAARAGDDWEQVPSGTDNGASTDNGGNPAVQEEAPPSSADDGEAVSDFLSRVNGAGKSGEACAVVGKFANLAATARDQGESRTRQLATVDSSIDKAAAQRGLPHEWSDPMKVVIHREVEYVYDHPGMKPEQVQSEWEGICETQSGR